VKHLQPKKKGKDFSCHEERAKRKKKERKKEENVFTPLAMSNMKLIFCFMSNVTLGLASMFERLPRSHSSLERKEGMRTKCFLLLHQLLYVTMQSGFLQTAKN
jgi:hypothetical protein